MSIEVLLPLYNPSGFLEQQMESIVNQTYSPMKMYIRDDGSNDDKKVNVMNLKINIPYKYEEGENKGVVASFLYLLKNSSNDVKYYSFSDQDDYWKKDKLERAVKYIQKYDNTVPVLYCASLDVVDEELNHLGSLGTRKKGASFNNAIVQNIATGCTIVLNKAARDLINEKTPNTDNIVMHDWWVYLVISAFGVVIYDDESVLYYRQHNNNTFGSGHGYFQRWIKRGQRFFSKKEAGIVIKQIEEFYSLYKYELSKEKLEIIEDLLQSRKSFSKRVLFSLKNIVYRQSFTENLVCHLLMILNKW